eukprot:354458-Chlamydomonas_euryale.AAC.4
MLQVRKLWGGRQWAWYGAGLAGAQWDGAGAWGSAAGVKRGRGRTRWGGMGPGGMGGTCFGTRGMGGTCFGMRAMGGTCLTMYGMGGTCFGIRWMGGTCFGMRGMGSNCEIGGAWFGLCPTMNHLVDECKFQHMLGGGAVHGGVHARMVTWRDHMLGGGAVHGGVHARMVAWRDHMLGGALAAPAVQQVRVVATPAFSKCDVLRCPDAHTMHLLLQPHAPLTPPRGHTSIRP